MSTLSPSGPQPKPQTLPSIDEAKFDDLNTILVGVLRTQPQEHARVRELVGFVDALRKLATAVPALQADLRALRQQVIELGQPPLQYGIYLGMREKIVAAVSEPEVFDAENQWDYIDAVLGSAIARETAASERERMQSVRQWCNELRSQLDDQRQLIIGVLGQRHEVHLASADIRPEELREGQEVVVNKMLNVVGTRGQYGRGDTAEVANVISPSGTAKVESIPNQGEYIEVQWAGGDKTERFQVLCSPSLRQALHRGDIVQLVEVAQDEVEATQADAKVVKRHRATAKVKPRLHVRSGGSEGIIVEISDDLFAAGVDIGDIVRVDTSLQFAYEKLPSYQTGGLALEDVPSVTFADIGGLDDQIEDIVDAIELPYLHRRLFEEYQLPRTKGIMLYGPPGCGKTMIAKAIANSLTQSIRRHLQRMEQCVELHLRLSNDPNNAHALQEYRILAAVGAAVAPTANALAENLSDSEARAQLNEELRVNEIDPDSAEEALEHLREVLHREDGVRSFFLNVKGPELLSKWVGESEHRIRKIFEEAKRSATFYTPVIIFFDEMEAMFRSRGSGRSSDVETTIVPQFLSEMDGVESSENVIIVGASNRPDMIDPAIMRPGRLDVKIKVDRPNREAAMKILALNLTPDLPLRADGLRQAPASMPQAITFKHHVVRRTLLACKHVVPAQTLEAVLASLPHGYDIRRLQAEGSGSVDLQDDDAVHGLLTAAAIREQVAEALIIATIDILFSPASLLEIVTTLAGHHVLPLHDFVSGALLTSVVSRAKKAAVKRRVSPDGATIGIGIADLRAAILEEFEENAEQFAANALEQELAPRMPGQPAGAVQFVEVHLGEWDDDPWSLPKARPYQLRN